jgi:hypothetical protein
MPGQKSIYETFLVTAYDTPATAGKQAIAGMVATARIPALS